MPSAGAAGTGITNRPTDNPCTGTTARPCLWLPRATANAHPAQGLLARRKTRFFRRPIGPTPTSSGPLCRVVPCCYEPFRAATLVKGRRGGNSIRISESPHSREVGPVQRTIYPAEYSRIDRITLRAESRYTNAASPSGIVCDIHAPCCNAPSRSKPLDGFMPETAMQAPLENTITARRSVTSPSPKKG